MRQDHNKTLEFFRGMAESMPNNFAGERGRGSEKILLHVRKPLRSCFELAYTTNSCSCTMDDAGYDVPAQMAQMAGPCKQPTPKRVVRRTVLASSKPDL